MESTATTGTAATALSGWIDRDFETPLCDIPHHHYIPPVYLRPLLSPLHQLSASIFH